MNDMKSLRQVIVEKGVEYEDEEIVPQFVGLIDGEPRVIYAILERTAVHHALDNDADRELKKLEQIMVWPRDIRWQRRPHIYRVGYGLTRFDSTRNHERERRNATSN